MVSACQNASNRPLRIAGSAALGIGGAALAAVIIWGCAKAHKRAMARYQLKMSQIDPNRVAHIQMQNELITMQRALEADFKQLHTLPDKAWLKELGVEQAKFNEVKVWTGELSPQDYTDLVYDEVGLWEELEFLAARVGKTPDQALKEVVSGKIPAYQNPYPAVPRRRDWTLVGLLGVAGVGAGVGFAVRGIWRAPCRTCRRHENEPKSAQS